jgi:hypothetical protein
MSGDEINEKDIDTVVKFLKIHDPGNATPEKAIELLEDLQAGTHQLAHSNPELLEKLHEALNSEN